MKVLLPRLCLFLPLLVACDSGSKRMPLQAVMFQVEHELGQTQLAVDAGDMAAVQTRIQSLRKWWQDPAHDLYIASGKITKDKEGFLKVRQALFDAMDRVEAAAKVGDKVTVGAENGALRATCDQCHITYRPLVTKRYAQ